MMLLVSGSLIQEADLLRELDLLGMEKKRKFEGDDLSAIEKQRIEQVLLEEKYNYSRAAKRLGISRTTLWRRSRP